VKFVRLCVFLSVFSASLSWCQDLGAWTDAYVKGLAPAKRFRGTITAERNGQVAVEKSYGNAIEEWQVPNTAQTRFEIASVSKQFTAAAILQLADGGKLNVTDPVGKYYREAPPAWKNITIHHLLTHSSGLPNNSLDNFPKGICTPYTAEELIKTFRDRPLAFEPGSSWAYTNTEYYLLAFVIQRVSGESYGDYLTRHISEPLKMTHSGFASTLAVVPQLAQGYTYEVSTLRHRDYFDRSLEIGAGGIYTNAEDLLRWNKALDSPGLLSAHALDLMFTAHPPGNYGYGWFVETSPRRKIYHEGGDPGFAAFEARYPDQHVIVIVLANEDDAPVREIAEAVAKRLLSDGR
jgi:D-alanyl-D-alanine carboxypeptidase